MHFKPVFIKKHTLQRATHEITKLQDESQKEEHVKKKNSLMQILKLLANLMLRSRSKSTFETNLHKLNLVTQLFFCSYRSRLLFSLIKVFKIHKINSVNFWEKKVFSQNGEDGILEIIFNLVGTTNKFFVEIGVDDGSECNTRYLKEKKDWNGIMMDDNPNTPSFIKKEFVTKENINLLFKTYDAPQEIDLFSLDIDSNEYWVWDKLNYNPRVVVVEYNGYQSETDCKTIEYDPNYTWDGTDYKGASLLALVKLAEKKNYSLVGCNNNGVNAFFVRKDLVQNHFKKQTISELYKPFTRCQKINGIFVSYNKSNKKWVEV